MQLAAVEHYVTRMHGTQLQAYTSIALFRNVHTLLACKHMLEATLAQSSPPLFFTLQHSARFLCSYDARAHPVSAFARYQGPANMVRVCQKGLWAPSATNQASRQARETGAQRHQGQNPGKAHDSGGTSAPHSSQGGAGCTLTQPHAPCCTATCQPCVVATRCSDLP